MDRLDMRDTHQHREVSPEEIRAIVAEQPDDLEGSTLWNLYASRA